MLLLKWLGTCSALSLSTSYTTKFNIKIIYVPSTQCIYAPCMDLIQYNDNFPVLN
jgi:hypothetical protein